MNMVTQKYQIIGTSVSTHMRNTKRKEVFVKPKLYSQQVDLSDFIGMDPETKAAVSSLPYEFRTRSGDVLLKGHTDNLGDTERIFTQKKEEILLYVGDGEWKLSMDCKHKF
jgi:hypothetical protein